MKYPTARIILMCKAPVVGEVKTRLIPALGDEGACQLHERLALRAVGAVLEADLCPLSIWCAPSHQHQFFQQFADCVTLFDQEGSNIGERMFHAARQELYDHQVDRVLIIGTDTPMIDAAYLEQALVMLADHDAVMGPAEDGGYVLLGLREAEQRVFSGITWSTDQVCQQTCRQLNSLGWQWGLLGRLWDVDDPVDLERIPAYLTGLV